MVEKTMSDKDDDEIVLKVEKDPLIGKTLAGRYQIVSVLGRGGMGTVYKAHQADIDRSVAIKTLHLSRIVDSTVIQKFRSEAQAVSRVRHPNTVMLYDFGVSEDGVPFLVMEMLDGVSFRHILKENVALNPGRANHIYQQVCSALAYAHEAGIVHKDLKPENIMLSNRAGQPDWVHVLDFGIAGLMESQDTEHKEIIGSPPYMSPEQCSGQAIIDHRSDIYSLGVCLFETLCGKFPFQARTAMEMLDCHVSGKPLMLRDMGTRFSTYESLTQVILKAMDKRPDKRQQSITEFASELNEAIRKDSKRGMQLRDRATLEVDAPRVSEFVAKADEAAAAEEESKTRGKGLKDSIINLVRGDENKDKNEEEEPKYFFSNCPHCDAPTQPGISLCLACGRSLVAKDDYSKLRAAKGDFSLPKYEASGVHPVVTPTARDISKRTRLATTRTHGVSPMIILCMMAGAAALVGVIVAIIGPDTVMAFINKLMNPN